MNAQRPLLPPAGLAGVTRELAALPTVIRRAQRLYRDAQFAHGRRLLRQALAAFDPITAGPDPRLLRAAMRYAEFLFDLRAESDHADTQLAWASYAQRAAASCYHEASPIRQATAHLYAEVCADQGLTFDAALTRRAQLDAYARHGPADHIPAVWEKYAVALHADGQCTEARTEIHDAFNYWKHTGIPAQPRGGQLLTTYAGILAGCGHADQACALLTDHAYLAAAAGTTDRRIIAMIAGVEIAIAEQRHLPACTVRPHPSSSPQGAPRVEFWSEILEDVLRPRPARG